MSDKQFEEYQHLKQALSEKHIQKSQDDKHNLAGEVTQQKRNEGRVKKRPSIMQNSVKEHIERQKDQNDPKGPWDAQENIIDTYPGEQLDQEEPEDPWPVRNTVFEEDSNKQPDQDYAQSMYDKEHISEEYLKDHQHDSHSETANVHSRLDSHFRFMRRFGSQYREVVAAANGISQQASRPHFMQQFWSRYKKVLASLHARPQQASHANFMHQLQSQYTEIVAAVSFLSILPLPGNAHGFLDSKETEKHRPQLVIGSAYFPLVGLMIALIACLLLVIGPALHLPPLVLAALLTVALVVLTGGLHLDGLMDSCDGLFGSSRRERQLEIMRDSHVGAFGVLGGVCVVLLKFAIFASLDPRHLALALVIVLPLARWAMILAISFFPSARVAGLGASAHQTITRPHILVAAITSLLIALIAGQLIGLVVWVVGSLVALTMSIWVTYALNGLTGDIYGAIAETTEVACFLVLVALR